MRQVKEWFYRLAASGLLPAKWFVTNRPEAEQLSPLNQPLKLEIVSHCWQYHEFLKYQLASLVIFTPQQTLVTMTVFYAQEDKDTVALLERFKKVNLDHVKWNFIALKPEQLMRRSIGRNLAAKATQADWVWFTDCDVLFYEGALDQLNDTLQGRQDLLVYPKQMLATPLLQKDEGVLARQTDEQIESWLLDQGEVAPRGFSRATGPIQITHGDVARACGYCAVLPYYQQPREHWAKTYEDRVFRWLLGTQGTPIEIENIYWIRHAEKGRYLKNSNWSKIRFAIRQLKEKLIGR